MSHTVGEKAALAVKNSEKKHAAETRTPAQRLADIRKNRAAKLFVTPDDQDFLLAQYDLVFASAVSYKESVEKSADEIVSLRAANEQAGRVVMNQTLKIQELTNEVAAIKGIVG
jgi:hypothetical protein